jgi:predicted phage replisome organizer
MASEVKWIKFATGFPSNRKIKQLRKLPDGDKIALMWVFLLCLAGDVNEQGLIYLTPEVPYTDEMLADEFDLDINVVRLGLEAFQRFGMIEVVNDIICLSSWEKWQSVDSLETIREQTRNRVAKHRAKQKLIASNVTGNVTVTQCNATDIDKEEDLEEEKEGDKDKRINNRGVSDETQPVKRFTPPTVDEVRDYCYERMNNVDPEAFVDFYSSKGWMVGKNKMKDWKAAVRTWERSRGEKQNTQKGRLDWIDDI